MLVEIFYEVDNFCKQFDNKEEKILIGKIRDRKSRLITSEIMTILIYYHHSGFKTFKDYYNILILGFLNKAFRETVSYNRFLELSNRCILPMFIFSSLFNKGKVTGISFIDSTSIKVCNNKRISSNKVFKGCAKRGKTSMGWFFGYKLHFVINEHGEIINFLITPGNVSDNNPNIIDTLTKGLYGKLFGDKGYLSKKIFLKLFDKGITLYTKLKKNMKNILMDLTDKILLRKRGLIESVGNLLKNKCQLEHTRHRSINGFWINLMATISAYNFRKNKPSIVNFDSSLDTIATQSLGMSATF